MSADKWVVCPFCEGTNEKPSIEYREQYGKISAADYQKLQEKYDRAMFVWNTTKGDQTVQMHYDVSVKKNGIEFGAFCKCDNCDKEWKHSGMFAIGTVV